ncbi:hypothetical protein TorRG33x02_001410 [Trema orientale]|uniref:Uncharacterized protein n=1 Tax=Trema orientale TaxID=63057 RepID=A0A2P5G1E5_TREOI|nr:hypothetical protein TorRG33x02_001410 [Trema orientale]
MDNQVVRWADLITSSGGWDVEMVRSLFDSESAKAVLRIPINRVMERGDANWFWAITSTGTFSVKSLYQVLMSEQVDGGAGGNMDKFWKDLWKLKIHLRHRLMWWQIAHEILPYGLVQALILRYCWTRKCENFEAFLCFAALCVELLWKEKNNILHGGAVESVEVLTRKLASSLEIYSHEILQGDELSKSMLSHWTPAPVPWIEVNVDVAVRENLSVAAAVARDEVGNILALQVEEV